MSLASHAPGDDQAPGLPAPRRPAVSSAPQARGPAWRAYTVVWRDGAACLAAADADVSDGSPATSVTGLPDLVVRTTIDRVRAAIINAGYSWPCRPAGGDGVSRRRDQQQRRDLAIAVAILVATGAVPRRHLAKDEMFFAELGLDGSLRPARSGTAEAVACAAAAGMRAMITAEGNASHAGAAQAPDVRIMTTPDLAGIPGLLAGSPDAPAQVLLPDAQDKRGGVTVDEHRVCAFRAFRRVVCSGCRRVAHGGGARGAGIAWMSLACAAGPGEGMGMPGTGPGGQLPGAGARAAAMPKRPRRASRSSSA